MVCQSDKGTAPIAKRVIKWAADELTDHYAYRYPNSLRHTCMECGHQWTISDAEKKYKHLTCPHCGRKLEVKETDIWDMSKKKKKTVASSGIGMLQKKQPLERIL